MKRMIKKNADDDDDDSDEDDDGGGDGCDDDDDDDGDDDDGDAVDNDNNGNAFVSAIVINQYVYKDSPVFKKKYLALTHCSTYFILIAGCDSH